MRSATDCAPKKCVNCRAKLPKPKAGIIIIKKIGNMPYDFRADHPLNNPWNQWHMWCKCGYVYVWSYHETSNGCWKLRHELPLFDPNKIIVVA